MSTRPSFDACCRTIFGPVGADDKHGTMMRNVDLPMLAPLVGTQPLQEKPDHLRVCSPNGFALFGADSPTHLGWDRCNALISGWFSRKPRYDRWRDAPQARRGAGNLRARINRDRPAGRCPRRPRWVGLEKKPP